MTQFSNNIAFAFDTTEVSLSKVKTKLLFPDAIRTLTSQGVTAQAGAGAGVTHASDHASWTW